MFNLLNEFRLFPLQLFYLIFPIGPYLLSQHSLELETSRARFRGQSLTKDHHVLYWRLVDVKSVVRTIPSKFSIKSVLRWHPSKEMNSFFVQGSKLRECYPSQPDR